MIKKISNGKTDDIDEKVVKTKVITVMVIVIAILDIFNLSIFSINNRSGHFEQIITAIKMI